MGTSLTENWLTVETADGPMRLFVVRPGTSQPVPGLVVIQEAFGVNFHIKDVCRRFARDGYVVASPELFHRQRVDTLPYREIAKAKELIASISADEIAEDIAASITALKVQPDVKSSEIGVVGYCFGGHCAYLAATRFPELKAVVVYYGGRIVSDGPGSLLDATPAIASPVLAHFGATDESIPPEHVEAIETALGALDVDSLVVTYPDAGHGFACDARPINFNADAAGAARNLTAAFLDAAFAGDPKPAKTVAAASGVGANGA